MSEIKSGFEDAGADDPVLKWKRDWDEETCEILNKLKKDLPELPSDAKSLGRGAHGITIDHRNGELSKIALVGEDRAAAQRLFDRESSILKGLQGKAYHTAITPPVSHVTPLPDSKMAVGAIRMQELEGDKFDWGKPSSPGMEDHFRNVGLCLAAFHSQSYDFLKDIEPLEKPMKNGGSIDPVLVLGKEINEALQRCNSHFLANLEPGVCHGDFHPLNFKVNKKKDVTGIFDVSFAGFHENSLLDFMNIPDEGLPAVLEEYANATGKTVDPEMVQLTKMSQSAAIINYQLKVGGTNKKFIEHHVRELIQRLNKFSALTGVTFDPDAAVAAYGIELQP